jgi:hypothetical protein
MDGSPDSGGSSGSGGTAGTGNDGGGGRRVLLVPDASLLVAGSTNDVGINGYWYCITNPVGPDQEPSTCRISATPDGVCIDAHVHRVEDFNGDQVIDATDWESYFGVLAVLQFNDAAPGENVYNAVTQGVEGFSFLFDGTSLPPLMRITYTTPAEYCKAFDAPSAGAYLALFSETRRACWFPEPLAGAPDPKVLYRLQLNFPAEATWPTKFRDFNFCVRNLRAQLR